MEPYSAALPLEHLEYELDTTLVQLETLESTDEDYESSKMELENRVRYLQYEIRHAGRERGDMESRSVTPGRTRYSPFVDGSHDYDDNIAALPASDSSSQGETYNPFLTSPVSLPSRKRQRESLDLVSQTQHLAKSSRPTPSSLSIASSPSASISDDFNDEESEMMRQLLGDTITEEYRGLERESRRAEHELRKRREQERKDEELARALQEEMNQQQPGPSAMARNTSQAVFDPATRRLRTMLPPAAPAKPSQTSFFKLSDQRHDQPSSSRTTLSDSGYSSAPNLLGNESSTSFYDLSSDDDDFQEIPSAQFRPNMNKTPQSYTLNNTFIPRVVPSWKHPHADYSPSPWVGAGGSNVYSNPAYDHLDHEIKSYPSAMGFASGTMPGAFPSLSDLSSFSPILPVPNVRDRLRYGIDGTTGNTEEEIKNLLENIRPDEEIAPEDREGDPEGMKCPLLPHQKLGLAWMKSMEEKSNKGGILADDMGLGKTVQALALIMARPSEDPQRKTTLIVGPVALMQQWRREIESKICATHRLSALVLHGNDRNIPWRDLKHYDIVLTTYGTIATEFKRKVAWDAKKKYNSNIRPSGKEDFLPVLGDECKWYRVILDESQHIKNKATKAALGASAIQSQYRWCMSGTPMMNNVLELYSLIHFLRIRPYNSSEAFNRDFTRPLKNSYPEHKERAMRALQVLLKAILLRRTKKSKIDGKPILQLPEKIVETTHAAFSRDELNFYQALEGRAQLTFNKYLKAGSVGRNYSNMLVLLLRLRQACCHPHLIKDFAIDTGANSEMDLKANAEAFGPDVVARLRDIEAFDCPVCIDAAENPQIFFPCGHAVCLDCFSRLSDPAQGLAEGREGVLQVKCPNCRAFIDPQKVTDFNTFKAVHFTSDVDEGTAQADSDEEEAASQAEADGEDIDTETDSGSDDESEAVDDSIKDFVVKDDDEEALKSRASNDDEDDDLNSRQPRNVKEEPVVEGKGKEKADGGKKKKAKKAKKKSKGKGKGKERDKLEKTQLSLAHLRREGQRNKASMRKYLKRLEENWITSAKIETTMEILEAVHNRGNREKTIVFSAFTSLLDLLEVPVSRKNWHYKRYDGSMTPNERNAAVNEFTDKSSCTIMLVSLKAGNAGLNLTAANNVVIFDPFWNPYIEEQAIDRAYRIGQMKEVHVHRVIVPDTVEDRILDLQAKKRELIENALDENAGRSVARLGVRELGFLFGVNRHI